MLQERRTINIRVLDEDTKNHLRETFDDLERKLGLDSLGLTLFYAVMELLSNAIKANIKRGFFRDLDSNLNDEEDYQRFIKEFKLYYHALPEEERARAFDHRGITIQIDLNQERLLVFVENGHVLLPVEERRIREKLSHSRETLNILEFNRKFGDDTEGKGLGLAMIVLLITDLGFDASLFRLYGGDNCTVARLEFPLSKSYTPIRDRKSA